MDEIQQEILEISKKFKAIQTQNKSIPIMRCPYCYKKFNKEHKFLIHKLAHESLSEDCKGIQCSTCNLYFLHSDEYEAHVQHFTHKQRIKERK